MPGSTLNSDRALRRLKPEMYSKPLRARDRSALVFMERLRPPLPKLLLDTTVYIDELQGRLPRSVEASLSVAELWHSTVTEAELTALAGLLDPAHPGTRQALAQVLASVARRPDHRIVTPDREIWHEAGIVAGLMARLERYNKAEQRRALNDALILLSAAKHGISVLTRNLGDFDRLTQLVPRAKAIFYDRAGSAR